MPCHPPFAIRIRVCTRPAGAVYLIYVPCARGVSEVASAYRNLTRIPAEGIETRNEKSPVDERKSRGSRGLNRRSRARARSRATGFASTETRGGRRRFKRREVPFNYRLNAGNKEGAKKCDVQLNFRWREIDAKLIEEFAVGWKRGGSRKFSDTSARSFFARRAIRTKYHDFYYYIILLTNISRTHIARNIM